MARYAAFLGLQVEVQYRAGDILLPASGTFVGDTGRSVFLEQCFEQRGQRRTFRWEIPYPYIVKLVLKSESDAAPPSSPAKTSFTAHQPSPEKNTEAHAPDDGLDESTDDQAKNAVSAAVGFAAQVTILFPRPQT